jgi:hypothetical protein
MPTNRQHSTSVGRTTVCAILAVLLAGTVSMPSLPAAHAQPQQQSSDEVVANLAAGRVAVLIAGDGIVVATAQSHVEPGTLPPLIVPMSGLRVAVLLGPVEWTWPGGGRPPLRLDVELRRSTPGRRAATSRDFGIAATDIETIGLGFLEPLRNAAALLHGPLHLQPHEAFSELMLVDYEPNYGPEAWSLRYHAEQELMRGDFYRTAVHRPEYVQLFPPEKGQPKTLMESTYPPNDPGEPAILDLLKANDSRLAPLRSADPGMGRAADLLVRGQSPKIKIEDGIELLRASFQAITPPDARQMILKITVQDGMKWVLGEGELAPLSPQDQKQADSSPPTLRKKPVPR